MSPTVAPRFAPAFFCPYCGEEDIRPVDLEPVGGPESSNLRRDRAGDTSPGGPAGGYRCESCLRAYSLQLRAHGGGA